jgi:uncharacterized protein YlxW (UPF0749 family)
MNSGELMVVLIVAIVMVAGIFKQRSRFSHRIDREPDSGAENQRLRDEIRELKERLKVLERITVDKENSLAKEIESLRDR